MVYLRINVLTKGCVSMDKKRKIYVFRYNFTTVGRTFTKLGRNVLIDDIYAVWKSRKCFAPDFFKECFEPHDF